MAVASVASSTTAALLLAAYGGRQGFIITNDDANDLYVLMGDGTASSSNYSFKLASGQDASISGYEGPIYGVWAADGSGSARITDW